MTCGGNCLVLTTTPIGGRPLRFPAIAYSTGNGLDFDGITAAVRTNGNGNFGVNNAGLPNGRGLLGSVSCSGTTGNVSSGSYPSIGICGSASCGGRNCGITLCANSGSTIASCTTSNVVSFHGNASNGRRLTLRDRDDATICNLSGFC